ncbi:hypothetical protein ABID19_003249 [Mesorhizobium robiniae]|uniref:Uncharacterized protein n=1 Tax=Mesorhizobium robiniae TaxID=559315 RepID=A0ABV2GPK7_9HYPH
MEGAFAEPRRPGDHVESGAKRTFRIVLMRNRRTEQGEQCIADEFVDETTEVSHGRRPFLEQFVLQRLRDLGVKLLAECREAAKVSEQNCYRPAIGVGDGMQAIFAFDVREQRRSSRRRHNGPAWCESRPFDGFCGRTDVCPAFRTELEIRCAGVAATGAWHGLAPTTPRTESVTALNLETAARAVHRT